MTSFFIDAGRDSYGTARRADGGPRFLRFFLAALGCLLLAGCAAPERGDDAVLAAATAAPQPSEPRLAEHEIVTADGAHLPLRVWQPRGRAKAVILALHGFNDYSNAFAGPAEALAWRGIATYAYDQRGFGAAPLHGLWPGRRRLAADLVTASRLVRQAHPGVPLYLLGESMGGAVVAVAMTGEAGTLPPEADGVILAAPAVWGWQTMGLLERSALWAGARLLPSLTLSGRGIIRIEPSDNVAMLRALWRDPLVIKATRIDTLYGLVDLMAAAYRSGPKLDTPLLYLYGDRDEVVPRAPTEQMIGSLPETASGRQRIAWYANGYHMLLRDLGAAAVVSDIASWIEARSAPLPSGADRYAEAVLGSRHIAQLSEARPRPATTGLPKDPPLR